MMHRPAGQGSVSSLTRSLTCTSHLRNLHDRNCRMPVKVNLWPLGSVKSWATNTNKARMAKTQARTEVAWMAWR